MKSLKKWLSKLKGDMSTFAFISSLCSIIGVPLAIICALVNSKWIFIIFFLVILIFYIILLYSYLIFRKKYVNIDQLYFENVPLVSIISYLVQTRTYLTENEISLSKVNIRYNFIVEKGVRQFEKNSFGGPFLEKEEIAYLFEGVNETCKSIPSFEINLIHSIFRSETNESRIHKAYQLINNKWEEMDVAIKKVHTLRDLATLTFLGEGVKPHHSIQYKLVKSGKSLFFSSAEHFLIDPRQYTNTTPEIVLSLFSDSNIINNAWVKLIEIDANSFEQYSSYTRLFKDFKDYSFTAKKGRVYLVRIRIED